VKYYEKIQKKINDLKYQDMRVITLECNHFADKLILVYEDVPQNVTYKFQECYQINFNHVKSYDKLRPVKDMSRAQLPYFIQNVEVFEVEEEGIVFYKCDINMFPLYPKFPFNLK